MPGIPPAMAANLVFGSTLIWETLPVRGWMDLGMAVGFFRSSSSTLANFPMRI